jgi:2-phosphosulfolactate phosphatase
MFGKRLKIDAFPESAFRYVEYDAIVCIDVLLATTTAVTGAALGRPVMPVASLEDALELGRQLKEPLMAGEVKGEQPVGFEIPNSPVALIRRTDVERPMVLLSSSGTHLIVNSSSLGNGPGPRVYVACFRNMSATAEYLASRHQRVALLGAGTRGEFRCEDQMGSAWIAKRLMARGFEAEDDNSANLVRRWSTADISLVAWGKSADSMRRSNQLEDLDFVLTHLDDLDFACELDAGVISRVPVARSPEPARRVAAPSVERPVSAAEL